MDIYIRTSNNTTAGVEFINKQNWEDEHTQPAGFTYTRTKNSHPVTYVPKEGMEDTIANLPYGEQQLAVLAILIDKLNREFWPPESITWIQEQKSTAIDILNFYGISLEEKGTPDLSREFQSILETYMRPDELAGSTVTIRISHEDTTNVELDNGYGCEYKNFLPKINHEGSQSNTRATLHIMLSRNSYMIASCTTSTETNENWFTQPLLSTS